MSEATANMFHDGDLQSGINLAVQHARAVLCFVTDQSETSQQWEDVIRDPALSKALTVQAVSLRIIAESQEAGYLSSICPIDSVPAIIVIKNAAVILNLKSSEVPFDVAKLRLETTFGVPHKKEVKDDAQEETQEVPSTMEPESTPAAAPPEIPVAASTGFIDLAEPAGRKRLPKNAYDVLRQHTQMLQEELKMPVEGIFQVQLMLLRKIPPLRSEIERLKTANSPEERYLSQSAQDRLLLTPAAMIEKHINGTDGSGPISINTAVASTSGGLSRSISAGQSAGPSPYQASTSPIDNKPDNSQEQRNEYIRQQREREQQERNERERIKAQIQADREARKHKGFKNVVLADSSSTSMSKPAPQVNADEIRIQVRTFDGSTLRNTFALTSNVSKDVRGWVDAASENSTPYNLKLILTPLPNRNIEPGEEGQTLFDLGIRNSCTMVMVPVKDFVGSYTTAEGGAAAMVGNALSGGYDIVSNTATSVYGGFKGFLSYVNGVEPQTHSRQRGQQVGSGAGTGNLSSYDQSADTSAMRSARVRTLADQRAEDAKNNQQFYNGNQLNFEPRKDDDDDRKKD